MDGARLRDRQYYGYAKSAKQIGLPFDLYRPAGALNPMDAANKVTTLPAHFTAGGSYTKPDGYGSATRQAMVDGRLTQVGDYLVGEGGPFFIAAMQHLLPILAVSCDRTVSITQGGTAPVAVGWPASVLMGGAGGSNPLEMLPGAPANPSWRMLLPAVPGLVFNTADLVTDDLLRVYFIDASELTDLGWRIIMHQATALTPSIVNQYATLIGLIGKTLTFRRVTKGTGPNPASTTTDYAVKGIVAAYENRLIDGTVVKLGDLRVILATATTAGAPLPAPTQTDQIGIDGAFRSVGVVKPLYAGPTVAVWEIQAKG